MRTQLDNGSKLITHILLSTPIQDRATNEETVKFINLNNKWEMSSRPLIILSLRHEGVSPLQTLL